MKKVLLIGAGQLGSRHLQGIARSEEPLSVTVVEPFALNLETAIDRFKEIEGHQKHSFVTHNDLAAVQHTSFDIAIIATNADVRAQITMNLLERLDVPYIIFEKVVFQSTKQFDQVLDKLQKKGIHSWVNCPRRHCDYYVQLKKKVRAQGSVKINVTGVEWGLACNSVHFIDLLFFLSGESEIMLTENNLIHKVFSSKRSGFIEFFGSFSGETPMGSSISLNCSRKASDDENPYQKITISLDDFALLISEATGDVMVMNNQGIIIANEKIEIVYQSMLTNLQMKQIFRTGQSELPDFLNSLNAHTFLFHALSEPYFASTGIRDIEFPIT